jgi:hypothetical protein
MRKRALGEDKGKAGAGMSKPFGKQEQLEKNKNKPSPYICSPYIGFYSKT